MDIKEKLKLMLDNPVVAWHEHIWSTSGGKALNLNLAENMIRACDKLGIDKLVTSIPVYGVKRCAPELFIEANNLTHEATRRYPGRVYGMGYVHPGYMDAALAEIDRCVNELGFVGIKLYFDYFMDDPVYDKIIDRCAEHDIPILMHSMHITSSAKIRQPLCSDGVHMANAARRHPEATFLMGHFTIAEWQWSLEAIADCPNVYTDISGSEYNAPQMEDAVRLLGADRIVFGTDNCWSSSAGKLLGAKISDEDKKTILAGKAFKRFIERVEK